MPSDSRSGSKKIFAVTGGAGFIGSHLVEALILDGHEVRIVDDLSSGLREQADPKADFFKADIRDMASLRPIFEGADGVFHMAAIVSVQYSLEHPEEVRAINVDGTGNVLDAAEEAGVKRLIFSSSCAVYGEKEGPIPEAAGFDPKSPYADQKLEGESLCDASPLETVALRYFNAYGPRQRGDSSYSGVIARFLKMKKEGKPFQIFGDGSQTRDFISVHDIVSANIAAMRADISKEAINVGSGAGTSVKELAEAIGGEIEYLPPRIEPKNSLADISKARSVLGWNPNVTLRQGIADLLKEHGIS